MAAVNDTGASPWLACETVNVELTGAIAIITIDRPQKRNALDTSTVNALGAFFADPPPSVKAAVLAPSGEHFSAGVDLSELRDDEILDGLLHSRNWHKQFDSMQYGRIPIVAVLRGAVIGGGLELALATHVRVAEPSTFYALPEGSRGIFVGGGASMRLPRLIGVHRMADMMLTGRVLSADEGHDVGISQYQADEGEGLERGVALANRIAENSAVTNFSVIQALPRIAEMSPDQGLFTESLMAAVSKKTPDALTMINDFLEGRAKKVNREDNVGG